MTATYDDLQGNGSNKNFTYTFPVILSTDVKVSVDGVTQTSGYTVNTGNTRVEFTTAPANLAKVRVYRETAVGKASGDEDPKAVFAAGSSVRAADLNSNFEQVLFAVHEKQNQLILAEDIDTDSVTTAKIKADAVTGAKIADDQINSEHYVDGSIDTAHIADLQVTTAKLAADVITQAKIADNAIGHDQLIDNSIHYHHIADSAVTTAKIDDNAVTTAKITDANVTTAKIADNAVTLAKLSSGALPTDITIASANLVDGTIATADIANDAITNAKIADDSIDSEHYVDGSIDTAHLADNSVTGAKLAAGTIGTTDLADSGVTTAKIADNNITTAKIAADAVTGAKIADDAVSTEHYAAGSVNNAAIGTNAVNSDQIAADAVTTAKIANDAITSAKIATGAIQTVDISNNTIVEALISDGEVTTAKIANDAITSSKIANDQIDSNHYVDGSIDTAHIGATQVTDAKLASNAVTTSKITDANVTTVKVADSNITLAKLASDLKQTSISNSDTQLPTSGAVVDYVAAQIAPIGGLEVIATDAAFPNTQPAAGVVISIADAGGLVVNGSGTSTTGRTVGASTVTINNIASNFNSTTVDAGVSFMVSSTGSGQIYNYHKATLKEADLLSLSGDINDFAERYRVAGSAPSSSLDDGDLWWDTATDKLKVYDGSSWEEVASSGDFYINTISSYSGTGGNSASFNGSAYRFVLSNPGSTAQQHVVSINGVIQKPNSGTSQPSEGFVIDGSSIIFSNAPASGADYFILTLGTTVSIGTPSDGTVTAAKIASGAVTTVKIADDAVTADKLANSINTEIAANTAKVSLDADSVTGAKIADDAVGAEHIEVLDTHLQFANNAYARFGNSNDLDIYHDGGSTSRIDSVGAGMDLEIRSDRALTLGTHTGSEKHLLATKNGAVELYYDNVWKLKTASNGVHLNDSLFIPDSEKAHFGAGDDLEIFHNGTSSLIDNKTGHLYLRNNVDDDDASNIYLQAKAGEESIVCNDDQGVQLYYDNVLKFETTSTGYKCGDDVKGVFGAGDDLQIYHDGTNSILLNSTGDLRIAAAGSGSLLLQAKDGEHSIIANEDAEVKLYYDNSEKIRTTSTGASVFGSLYCSDHLNLTNDNKKINLGDSSDLEIYHSGSHSYIKDTGTGALNFCASALYVTNAADSENMIAATENGGVSLYYDNTKKIETKSYGVNMPDNSQLYFGTGDDLCIKHDGSHSSIANATGDFYIAGDTVKIVNGAINEDMIVCTANGSVSLRYNNAQKLETLSNGIGFDGDSSSCALRFKSDGSIRGYFYADNSSNTGHLNNSGSWKWKVENDGDYVFYGSNVSDRDRKDNITTISDTSLDKITKLVPKTYKWKNLDGITPTDKTFTGFIAQEVKEHLPSLVTGTDGQKNMAVDYNGILAYAVKAITELSAEVETLKTKVAALEAK